MNGKLNMSNERYKLMVIERHAVKMDCDPLSLMFVSPPTKGKTDTKRTFLHNFLDCNEITNMSDTAMGDALVTKKETPVLILDDPLNWCSDDFESAIRYFKHLYEGFITTPRRTKFNPNDVPIPANINTVIFLHTKQYADVERIFGLTGFDERVLMVWSMHDSTTVKNIGVYYRKYKINTGRGKYPIFDIDDLELQNPLREIEPKEEQWIEDIFKGTSQERTVRTICSCVSKKSFETLKEALKSNNKRAMFIETIKFEDKEKKKSNETEDEWITRIDKEGN